MQADHQARLSELITQYQTLPGALLPLLQAIQQALGYIPDDAVPLIASALNQSQAEIRGVLSFYHDFRSSPATPHVLRLCRAEACQSMGAEALAVQLQQQLPADSPHITVETVYCLGACACAPALQLNGQLHARVDQNQLTNLLASCQQEPASC